MKSLSIFHLILLFMPISSALKHLSLASRNMGGNAPNQKSAIHKALIGDNHGHVLQRRDGSTSIAPANITNDGFVMSVDVGEGSSAKTFRVAITTSNSDFWLFSSFLPPNETSGHRLYNPSTSTSAIALNRHFNITDDGGTPSGPVYADSLSLGNLVLKNQAIGAASKIVRPNIVRSLIESDLDGVMGLSLRPHKAQVR